MISLVLSALVQVAFCHDVCESATIDPNALTGFSVFHARDNDHVAFKQDLRTMIAKSRQEPGVVSYDMYENVAGAPGAIGFVERWRDAAALQTHLRGANVRDIFAHPYYLNMKSADAQVFGPWTPVASEPTKDEELELVFYWTMDCPKQHVWKVITNWDSASWVLGSPATELVPVPKSVCRDERVQRRKFANGLTIDVCMISKDDATFVTVQETVNGLRFPDVTFEKFFVTLSLDNAGLDPDTQSRMRYHTRATMSKGTFEQGRAALKADFYGPRISFYQSFFNCTRGINVKRALATVTHLHQAIRNGTSVAPFFASDTARAAFVKATTVVDNAVSVDVKLAIAPVALPDLRVVTVEDIVSTSALESATRSRIVVYQLNEHGGIESLRLFDELTALNTHSPVVKAMDRYFDVLTSNDKEKVRALYAPNAVLEDPTGFVQPRTFDSVYTNFYTLAKSFKYTRSPRRTYVLGNQVAQVVDAQFVLASTGAPLHSTPVQIFTFDAGDQKITHFEAFFTPTSIDFSKL